MHPRCGLFLQLTETEFHNKAQHSFGFQSQKLLYLPNFCIGALMEHFFIHCEHELKVLGSFKEGLQDLTFC